MSFRQQNWKRLLKQHGQLLLPSVCDALGAKLIQHCGFPAYQIGGFALDGMRHGFPDMDVARLGEKSAAVQDIIHACDLPVLVDADDGYGDEKNVTHTVHVYDDIGASAIFIEDQKAPKRCGHMGGKEVIPAKQMVSKIKAARNARRVAEKLFIVARTDALEPEGLGSALKRAETYLKAGTDGIYIEGPHDIRQMQTIGREFRGEAIAITMLEGGGKTPILPPKELAAMGFNMVLYPTTLLFRITHTMLQALQDIKAGRPMPADQSVTMMEFEKLVDIAYWKSIEMRALPLGERLRQGINALFKRVA